MSLDKNCHKCGNEDSSVKWAQKVHYAKNEVVNYEVLKMTCKECGWSWETETLDSKDKQL